MTATSSIKTVYDLGNNKTESKVYSNINPAASDADVAAAAAQINNLQSKAVKKVMRIDSKQITE